MTAAQNPAYYRLGLTGYPLGHSLSPQMHTAALAALGLAGEYQLYPVAPEQAGAGLAGLAGLACLLDRLRRGELHGLNVTIPHKRAVLPLLDELTPVAQAVGAANTLYLRSGRLVGDNTDAPGFLADLERFLAGSRVEARQETGPPHALLLGAGGSARAAAYALAYAGWQVTVAARRPEQAQALLAETGLRPFGASILLEAGALAGLTPPPMLIVNTTPLGMAPAVEGNPWPAGLPLPPAAAVYDLVYNPAQTALLAAARRAGLLAVNGLGMLVEQAALAFERWTGRTAPRERMRSAILQENQ